MVTNVKMEVTPDLSRRVQEVVFANGGEWRSVGIKIINTEWHYLFISDKEIHYDKDRDYFKIHSFEEISPYDFIASQGQQKWLPKYGEEAEFSDNKAFWRIDTFYTYNPNSKYNYGCTLNAYRYCRPLKQTKTITIDGKDIEISNRSFEELKQQLCD